ncbi:MAG: ATP-dependent DNA helicase RecG [Termitinemataceae bacterium]|nr:MAG: ATP-dependent DNA helicase RecG [Termitinemataceae bacterium]
MFVREIKIPTGNIKVKGAEKKETQFARLGIANVGSLLCHYPRERDDRRFSIPLKDFYKNTDGKVCNRFLVIAQEWFEGRAKRLLKIHIQDETGRAVLKCFENRKYLEHVLPVGKYFFLTGKFSYKDGELQSSNFENPEVDIATETDNSVNTEDGTKKFGNGKSFGIIYPIYPLTAGLSNIELIKIMKKALQQYANAIEDELPKSIIQKHRLFTKAQSLCAIHFPQSPTALEKAIQTLSYEELFFMEMLVGMRAQERKKLVDTNIKTNDTLTNGELSPLQRQLIERMTFSLTEGQQAAIKEINTDLEKSYSMSRLLQGDVGSGKTLVSFLAAVKVKEKGAQTVIMAPTELLSRQHAENAAKLLEPIGIRVAFLTGNIKSNGRKNLLSALKNGDIDLVLGTHALFSSGVVYKRLSLVVIDEQHRFGVTQRQAILSKGENCDLLMMSATPIPRTLALTVFGDMDISVIKDMPPGRKPIQTHLARLSNIKNVYNSVRFELEAGHQAYFVYPLIESNEDSNLKDAVSTADYLAKEIFPNFTCALIHSKVPDDEKQTIMENFRLGAVQILIATSVVEVGVDVPNATCIVVEQAERFGLSALHQLRGRVGRGNSPSYCFLVYSDGVKDDGKQRLMVMLKNNDGFIIAEEDFKLRGPGQIAGTEQSGNFSLGIANPISDVKILEHARRDAFAILENDPELNSEDNKVIKQVLQRASPFSY